MDLEKGKKLVKLARQTIQNKLANKETQDNSFKEKRGCFVTLTTYPEKNLRGCIGYIEPIYPLSEALTKCAISSAFEDPRFEPLKKEELANLTIEVSVLTLPKLLKVKSPEEYVEKIELGKHGLIVELEDFRGLFLPKVATQNNWSVEEFLTQTCLKASLIEDTWKQGTCKIYTFETKIFSELKPNGKIKTQ